MNIKTDLVKMEDILKYICLWKYLDYNLCNKSIKKYNVANVDT